ncbi:hypothetical protein [Enterobacter cloacae complex sp. SHL009]|uniref:hypothetical protein n=1 Tax=Enterobacter cloacae complex sp. SHL009 TaxID=3412392 RepID=UPI003B9A4DD5
MRHLLCTVTVFAVLISVPAFADQQCGDFKIHWADDGLARINGAKPEMQKITFLKNKDDYNNIKMDWRMATDQPGRWVGLEYINRNGKVILNAQWLQTSMDAPRQYATYDCVKVM